MTDRVIRNKACTWRFNESHAYWKTGCGNSFSFIDLGWKENNFRFCPYCGGLLKSPPREGGSRED